MKGFSYPFTMTDEGPEVAEDEELVASAMAQLQSQEPDERPFQPYNGVSLWKYLFSNAEDLARGEIRREMMLAVTRNEPRVDPVRFPIRLKKTDFGAWEVELVTEWRYGRNVYSSKRTVRPTPDNNTPR